MTDNKFKITDEELERVLLASPYALPDSPGERGMDAKAVKRYFYHPLRLLTGYINSKLESIIETGDVISPSPHIWDGGEDIKFLDMWLDPMYREDGKLVNLACPKERVLLADGAEYGNSYKFRKGADIPLTYGEDPFTVSLYCDTNDTPSCIFSLTESDRTYIEVYKIGPSLYKVEYASAVSGEHESYIFDVKKEGYIHLCAVKSADSVAIYANGALISAFSIPMFEPASLILSGNRSGHVYEMIFRALRMYSYAVPPSEIGSKYEKDMERELRVSEGKVPVFDLSLINSAYISRLFSSAAFDISAELDQSTYTLSFMPRAADGTPLLDHPHTVDLPLEEMIVGGEYEDTDEHPASLKLLLKSGGSVYIPVGDLIGGLAKSGELASLVSRVSQAEGRMRDTETSAFFGASFNGEERTLSFLSKGGDSVGVSITLDNMARECHKHILASSPRCRFLSDASKYVKVTPRRKNRIIRSATVSNALGSISSEANEVIYSAPKDAYIYLLCDSMEHGELYTLSFDVNDYTGTFTMGVYNKDHITLRGGERNFIYFTYDKLYNDGLILVDDGIRTSVDAILSNFTVTKGTDERYYPIVPSSSVTVKGCGKNLLDLNGLSAAPVTNGTSYTTENALVITSNGLPCNVSADTDNLKIYVNEGETLCFSWSVGSGSSEGYAELLANGSEEARIRVSASAKNIVYTVPKGVDFITYRMGVSDLGGSVSFYKPQIEISQAPTQYSRYEATKSLYLPVNASGYMDALMGEMNIFTPSESFNMEVEYIRDGDGARSWELLSHENERRISAVENEPVICAARAHYSTTEHKVMLKLTMRDGTETDVDMTDPISQYISKEFFGGVQ